jgi:hypothetical protein
MFYDAALIHLFRVLINSSLCRWCAQTRSGVWFIELLEQWIQRASQRICVKKSSVTDRLHRRILELEALVQQMRAELAHLKKITKKR